MAFQIFYSSSCVSAFFNVGEVHFLHQRTLWPSQNLIQTWHEHSRGLLHMQKQSVACFNDPIVFMPLQRHLVLLESCWFDFSSQSLPHEHVITGKSCRVQQVVIYHNYAPCFSENCFYINPSCQTLSCLSRVLRSIGWSSLNMCVLHAPFPPVQPCRKIMVWIPAVSVLPVIRGDPTVLRSPPKHKPPSHSSAAAEQFAGCCIFQFVRGHRGITGCVSLTIVRLFEMLSTDLYCSLCYCSISTFPDFIPTLL